MNIRERINYLLEKYDEHNSQHISPALLHQLPAMLATQTHIDEYFAQA